MLYEVITGYGGVFRTEEEELSVSGMTCPCVKHPEERNGRESAHRRPLEIANLEGHLEGQIFLREASLEGEAHGASDRLPAGKP